MEGHCPCFEVDTCLRGEQGDELLEFSRGAKAVVLGKLLKGMESHDAIAVGVAGGLGRRLRPFVAGGATVTLLFRLCCIAYVDGGLPRAEEGDLEVGLGRGVAVGSLTAETPYGARERVALGLRGARGEAEEYS